MDDEPRRGTVGVLLGAALGCLTLRTLGASRVVSRVCGFVLFFSIKRKAVVDIRTLVVRGSISTSFKHDRYISERASPSTIVVISERTVLASDPRHLSARTLSRLPQGGVVVADALEGLDACLLSLRLGRVRDALVAVHFDDFREGRTRLGGLCLLYSSSCHFAFVMSPQMHGMGSKAWDGVACGISKSAVGGQNCARLHGT